MGGMESGVDIVAAKEGGTCPFFGAVFSDPCPTLGLPTLAPAVSREAGTCIGRCDPCSAVDAGEPRLADGLACSLRCTAEATRCASR